MKTVAYLEAEIDRLGQEIRNLGTNNKALRIALDVAGRAVDQEHAKAVKLRQAILDAHDEGCACDWHIYGQDVALLTEDYAHYTSQLEYFQAALLEEQRKGDDKDARIRELTDHNLELQRIIRVQHGSAA